MIMTKKILPFLFSLCGFLIITNTLAATQPKYTLIPTTPTTITVSVSNINTMQIQYRVTNQTKVTRTLTMSPIAGITQQTSSSDYCANPFMLAQGQSCLLTLSFVGTTLPGAITSGPVVCAKQETDNIPDLFLCSQPSEADLLNITLAPAEVVSLSATPTHLLLYAASLTSNTITVTNHSTDAIASNISAELAGTALANTVIQDTSNCTSVLPGDTCTLTFMPKDTLVATSTVSIRGTNTTTVPVSITITYLPQAYLSGASSGPGIYQCPINTTNETLSACTNYSSTELTGSSAALNSPAGIAINLLSPTTTINYAYIANTANSTVLQCSLNVVTGVLSSCLPTGSGTIGFSTPLDIAINPNAMFAYITNNVVSSSGSGSIVQCSIDANTGYLTGCIDSGIVLPNSGTPSGIALSTINAVTYAY